MLDTTNPNHYGFTTRHLKISVLGGVRLNKLDSLRVTLSITKIGNPIRLRHNIDLYNDNQTEKLVRKVAERLEIGTSVTRRALQQLTDELERYRIGQLDKEGEEEQVRELTGNEEKKVIQFLRSKDLLVKTNKLIGQSGVIGEETNRLLMYIIFTSRKSANPLHCISLGSSGVGKTHLQSKVAELIPEHEIVDMTVLSENAFYYFNRTELRNKLILIEDMDGAEAALYPLRELQSKRSITKRVSHKDRNGSTKTIKLTVEGPVCVAGCTTQESFYEDNSNRSFLLYIDESGEQDERIMQYQRRAAAGIIDQDSEIEVRRFLQSVQMVLRPIRVINPYALHLGLPQSVFKPRRTNAHYLQFIEAITFYKQQQREKKYDQGTGEEYIETEIEDIREANQLIKQVLLRKSDTITGACRNYFEALKALLEKENTTTFTAYEVRRKLKVKKTTQWRYHKQLLEGRYIQKASKKGESIVRYEVTNPKEYKELETEITRAMRECLEHAERSIVPERSTGKVERTTKRKRAG
jgi:predicted transcriptional regulator